MWASKSPPTRSSLSTMTVRMAVSPTSRSLA